MRTSVAQSRKTTQEKRAFSTRERVPLVGIDEPNFRGRILAFLDEQVFFTAFSLPVSRDGLAASIEV
jgi:hypothetical protein